MKNIISIFLCTALIVSLAACSKDTATDNSINTSTTAGADTTIVENAKEKEPELIITINDTPGINAERFPELVETVELTTENWRDYIDFAFFTYHDETKNAFGEVIETTAYTSRHIIVKTDKYYQIVGTEEKPAAIELQHRTTGKSEILALEGTDFLYTFSYSNVGESYFEENKMDNYDCLRIQGTLYIVDIPQEVLIDSGDDFVGLMFSVIKENTAVGYFGVTSTTHKIHMNSVADVLKECN